MLIQLESKFNEFSVDWWRRSLVLFYLFKINAAIDSVTKMEWLIVVLSNTGRKVEVLNKCKIFCQPVVKSYQIAALNNSLIAIIAISAVHKLL